MCTSINLWNRVFSRNFTRKTKSPRQYYQCLLGSLPQLLLSLLLSPASFPAPPSPSLPFSSLLWLSLPPSLPCLSLLRLSPNFPSLALSLQIKHVWKYVWGILQHPEQRSCQPRTGVSAKLSTPTPFSSLLCLVTTVLFVFLVPPGRTCQVSCVSVFMP